MSDGARPPGATPPPSSPPSRRLAKSVPSPDEPLSRRFVNNPFARALHPLPSQSLTARVALGLVSVAGALIMATALLLPLAFVPGLLVGGVHARRFGMIVTGLVIVFVYLLIIVATVRKLVTRRPRGS